MPSHCGIASGLNLIPNNKRIFHLANDRFQSILLKNSPKKALCWSDGSMDRAFRGLAVAELLCCTTLSVHSLSFSLKWEHLPLVLERSARQISPNVGDFGQSRPK